MAESDGAAGVFRWHDGREEPILDPGLRIIDAHHHLFDRPGVHYTFPEYLEDVEAGHNVVASVYIETGEMARQDGPPVLRPLGEVEYANGVAAMSASGKYGASRVAASIVGNANLALGDPVAELLDRSIACAPDRYRGVRMTTLETSSTAWLRYVTMKIDPVRGVLTSTAFREGFRHLAPRGLTYDANVFHSQLDDVAALANEFPDTTIVLGHMGLALALDVDSRARAEVFRDWSVRLGRLAQHSNVVCKVGGLGLPFWGFGLHERSEPVASVELGELWRPYVETAISIFGADRCLMESNFPPDARSCGYVPLWNALKYIASQYSLAERTALFHDNAVRIYRMQLPRAGAAESKDPG